MQNRNRIDTESLFILAIGIIHPETYELKEEKNRKEKKKKGKRITHFANDAFFQQNLMFFLTVIKVCETFSFLFHYAIVITGILTKSRSNYSKCRAGYLKHHMIF